MQLLATMACIDHPVISIPTYDVRHQVFACRDKHPSDTRYVHERQKYTGTMRPQLVRKTIRIAPNTWL
jgi:hypothetical protein